MSECECGGCEYFHTIKFLRGRVNSDGSVDKVALKSSNFGACEKEESEYYKFLFLSDRAAPICYEERLGCVRTYVETEG